MAKLKMCCLTHTLTFDSHQPPISDSAFHYLRNHKVVKSFICLMQVLRQKNEALKQEMEVLKRKAAEQVKWFKV